MSVEIKSPNGVLAELDYESRWTLNNTTDGSDDVLLKLLSTATHLAASEYTAGQGDPIGFVGKRVAELIGWDVVRIRLEDADRDVVY